MYRASLVATSWNKSSLRYVMTLRHVVKIWWSVKDSRLLLWKWSFQDSWRPLCDRLRWNLSETDRSSKAQRRALSWSSDGGITIAAAKRSSEDAATLVQYLIAIVKYSRLHAAQRAAINKQTALQNELAEHERRLQDELNKVYEHYTYAWLAYRCCLHAWAKSV